MDVCPEPLRDRCCTVKIESALYQTLTVSQMRERRGNASQCEQEAHEARKRDRRKKKLIHGIADPLTKLSLTITAGGIQHRSVRESSGSGGRREEGPGENVSRVARGSACEAT